MTSSGLTPDGKETIRAMAEEMAARGLRVLGLAARQWAVVPATADWHGLESELVFIGLAGITDPPREEAKAAVAECRNAGIIPVMITGDHPVTARNIAERLGIIHPDDRLGMLTGAELERLSPEDFAGRVEQIRVYARVAPEQKLRIVKALQERGQFAAMTGDGVNDAPALKRADIGVAMGITGTEVSKEAASMILLDDNFATIVKAVREGRRIFDNIRRFVRYVLTCNSGEIWTIFLAPFLGLPIPLLPIQILWINLVTDGLPGLALAAEPGEPDIMKRPPRSPKESLFADGLGVHVIWVGLLMGLLCLGTQTWAIKTGAHWQTIVFTVLCLSQLGHALAIRSERRSLFTMGIRSNMPLLYSLLLTVVLQTATIYLPFLNRIFHTVPLTMGELAVAFALSMVVFFAVEVEKLIRRRRL
jgi:Ca2+-transporting ATPase